MLEPRDKRFREILNTFGSSTWAPDGGEIDDPFSKRSTISPLVGKLLTVSKMGQQFPHQWIPKFLWWGNYWPIFLSVNNFPTSGEIIDRFENRSTISPPPEFQISLVGKLLTVSENGHQFPHQWNQNILGGEIIDRFFYRSTISPRTNLHLVGRF